MIVAAHRGAAAPGSPATRSRTCHHLVGCPAATAPGRHAARTVATHPEQGWSLLCNGVILFDDNSELVPGDA
jgi:hypothetical protein